MPRCVCVGGPLKLINDENCLLIYNIFKKLSFMLPQFLEHCKVSQWNNKINICVFSPCSSFQFAIYAFKFYNIRQKRVEFCNAIQGLSCMIQCYGFVKIYRIWYQPEILHVVDFLRFFKQQTDLGMDFFKICRRRNHKYGLLCTYYDKWRQLDSWSG